MTQQSTALSEVFSDSIFIELGNFMESVSTNLRFHIFQIASEYIASNLDLEEDDIEREGKQWFTNTLLVMLINLGSGMSVKQRVSLMDNLLLA